MQLGQWSSNYSFQQVLNGPNISIQSGGIPTLNWSTPITNADTGVFFSWEENFAGGSTTFNIATTSGPGIASQNAITSVPDQAVPLKPILQRQDGNYVGTVGIGPQPGQVTQTNMVAFSSSGLQLWNQQNYAPQIATSDNGVIATSQSGQAVTFDQNGSQTGQLSSLPMQSWTANAYQLGSTESVAALPIDLAASFSPVLGGNPSTPGTAIEPVTQDVRAKIAQLASSKVGSQNWLDQVGLNKCNIFVHDVLKEAGTTPPESDATSWKHRAAYYLGRVDSLNYPAQAGDWANPGKTLGCWKTLVVPDQPRPQPLLPDISIPGDVIAEAIHYSDATGHVGIVIGTQQTASADSTTNCDSSGLPLGVITITDYGFRPDNYRECVICLTVVLRCLLMARKDTLWSKGSCVSEHC